MPRDEETEDATAEAIEAFLASGGCTGQHDYDPQRKSVRKCCAIAFCAGTRVEFVYPANADELEEDDGTEEEPEGDEPAEGQH